MAAPSNLQHYQAQLQANQAALGQQLLLPQRESRLLYTNLPTPSHPPGSALSCPSPANSVAMPQPATIPGVAMGAILFFCPRRLCVLSLDMDAHARAGVAC